MDHQTALRQRHTADSLKPSDSPSASESPTSSPKLTRRPTLSRTVTGDSAQAYEVDEPLFSGLGLLDLLVVVDAHLELWTRGLRKKGSSWKSKADRLVEESRARAQKINRIKLPKVTSETFISTMLDEGRDAGILSQADRDKLERRLRDVRAKTTESMKKMIVAWEREKNVQLREKISFFCGVMNVLGSALLVQTPEWIPLWYTIQVGVQLPLRAYSYKKKSFHYFLFDLCYAVNLICLVFLWIAPGNEYLFQACWGLTLGTLGTAIATWRNSLVFHSLDKVISLTIHIYPPFVFTMIRHYLPRAEAEARYPALAKLPTIKPWTCIGVNMLAYLIWQGLYFRYVIIARREKIKQGRVTSFTWMINDKKSLIGKIGQKVPENLRETAFMGGQAIYTFVTLLVPVFVLYDSKVWCSIYLLAVFGVSVWNGASFYMEVFSRKFEKELLALRKEFEQQQNELVRLTANPNAPSEADHDEKAPPSPYPVTEDEREGDEGEGRDARNKRMGEPSPMALGEQRDTSPLLKPRGSLEGEPKAPSSVGEVAHAASAVATGAADELHDAADEQDGKAQ